MASVNKPQNQVAHLYERVIQDVINNVRDSFLDDGVDEQVLQELKQIWETKLSQTKAVDSPTIGDRMAPSVYRYAPMTSQKSTQLVYQVPTQLSAASQQGRAAVPGVIYPRGSILLPSKNPQIFSSYQPVATLRQPVPQQVISGAETIVLASTSKAPLQGGSKPGSSNVPQVDGSTDEIDSKVQNGVQSNGESLLISLSRKSRKRNPAQLDGKDDSSSSDDDLDRDDDDDDDEDDDDDDGDDDENEETQEKEQVDEEPLNSEDDDSDQDANELFDVENVVVCQYDKIHRAKAKWKFTLKVGIMNLEGKDHVFQKATGEADW